MLNIRLICFREDTGYGNASRTLYNQLKQVNGINIDRIEILPGALDQGGLQLPDGLAHDAPVDHVIIHTVPEYFPYWYCKEKNKSSKTVVWGYTTWETDVLPAHWTKLLNQMDAIFVPCRWNIAVFKSCGVNRPIVCLPHLSEYEGQVNHPVTGYRSPFADNNHFIFYSIGIWNERKNPGDLVTAFLNEFSAEEKVALVLKTTKVDWTMYRRTWKRCFRKSFGKAEDAMKKLTKNRNARNVYHLTDQLSAGEMSVLHQSCNCFISFTRGEGWGMGAFEAAWFGKPIAIPKHSGQVDFLSEADAYWLEYQMVPVKTSFGKKSYSGNQKWVQVDLKAAQQTMRTIFENQTAAATKGRRLHEHVKVHLQAEKIIKNLLRTLHEFNS